MRRPLGVVHEADVAFFTNLHLAAVGFSRALVEGPTGPVLRPTKNRTPVDEHR